MHSSPSVDPEHSSGNRFYAFLTMILRPGSVRATYRFATIGSKEVGTLQRCHSECVGRSGHDRGGDAIFLDRIVAFRP